MNAETSKEADKPLYHILISPLGGYRVIRAKTGVSPDWSILEGAASYQEASDRMRELIETRDREFDLGRGLVFKVLHRTYPRLRVSVSDLRSKGFSSALEGYNNLSDPDRKYLSWLDANPAVLATIESRQAA